MARYQRPVWKRLHEYARKEPVKHGFVREEIQAGRTVYLCSCGLGYDDPLIAFACEEYARTHGVNQEEIIKSRLQPTKRPACQPNHCNAIELQ